MNDFERRLSDALKQTTEHYRPRDPYRAKERFLQRARRRRLFLASGGVALAGATAAAAFLFFTGEGIAPRRAEPLPPASELDEVREIAVGERPSGVAFGDGLVWVANAGDGNVMAIDPETRAIVKTFDVGGDPDDVAVGVGAAWVSDSGAGTITSLPLPSFDVQLKQVTIPVGEPGSTHMDVAPGAGGLWVAKDDSLWRIDPMSLEPQQIDSVEGPTDVAVGEGSVYVLGRTELARVDPAAPYAVTHIADISESRNQDLAFREGFLWLADGDSGEVTRIDPETGRRSSPIYVGGNFSGIAVDEEGVWVISGGAGDSGVLTRIDPDTLAPLLPRAELTGRPYDITLGAGRVWVANQSAGTVTAIDPNDLPNATNGDPAEGDDIVFAYSSNGDILGETFSGRTKTLVAGSDVERNPSFSPDGASLAFERLREASETPEIYVVDLASGEETRVAQGSNPAFGPDGRLAWFQPTTDRDAPDWEIAVATVGEEPITFDATIDWRDPDDYGPPRVGNLTWDLTGDNLYYNQIGGGTIVSGGLLYQADPNEQQEPLEFIPGNHNAGDAQYHAPSVRSETGVHVVQLCCESVSRAALAEIEMGMIAFGEGGPSYETVVELPSDVFGIPHDAAVADPFDDDDHFFDSVELVSAGNLALEGSGNDRQWRHTVVRSWFVTTPDGIWLVDANGQITDVSNAIGDVSDLAGIDTAPEFDD